MSADIYRTLPQIILCLMPLLVLLYFKQYLNVGNGKYYIENKDIKYINSNKESSLIQSERRNSLQYYENAQSESRNAERDGNQFDLGKMRKRPSRTCHKREINPVNKHFTLNFFKKVTQFNRNDKKRGCNCCNRSKIERDNSITIIKILSDQIQY